MYDAEKNNFNPLFQEPPEFTGCSFSWSIDIILSRLGLNVPFFDIRGFSLNAFSIWAHPEKPISTWPDSNSDLFSETLLRSLGLRGELLKIPDKEHDLLGYFIRHWSERVMENLVRGVPVASAAAWTSSTWGIITEWDKEKRILKGFIPNNEEKLANDSWPRKILLIGGKAVSLKHNASIRLILKQALELASNRIGKGKWVSGIDAFILWQQKISENYSRSALDHNTFSIYISESRRDAARFLTHHADFYDSDTERMMLSIAKQYKKVSENLKEATNSTSTKSFLDTTTEAVRAEEKALLLLEELSFRTE